MKKAKLEKATFAAGCFWHVQGDFSKIKGVKKTVVGYTGGTLKNPTYNDVCTGRTGHAESVKVTFDPSVVSYEKLLDHFWDMHNPTTLNRQGLDIGTQYRSAIFYHNEKQKKIAEESKKELEASGKYRKNIVTEIVPAKTFYKAEEYHQNYLHKNKLNICLRM